MAKKKKLQPLSKVIQGRRNAALDREDTISLIFRLVFLALIAWILFAQVFLITQASGSDMFPAIKDGDLIIAYRLQKEYVKEDVVIYTQDGKTRVGRIIARDNDTVNMDDSGTLQVNGTNQAGEIMYPTFAKENVTYPITMTQGQSFILGDYRTQCEDSRDFGPVPVENIQAKVITILRRRGL